MPTNDASTPRILSAEQFGLLTARLEGRIVLISGTMFFTGLVQGLRHSWNAQALLLLVGAVLAVLGMGLYGGSLRSKKPSWTAFGSGLGGFAPYLFGCYLVFIRGMWNARHLLQAFTIGSLLASAAFIYLGYRLVYWTGRLSEIGEGLRTGQIVISGNKRSM